MLTSEESLRKRNSFTLHILIRPANGSLDYIYPCVLIYVLKSNLLGDSETVVALRILEVITPCGVYMLAGDGM